MAKITINDYCKKAYKFFIEDCGMTPYGSAGMCGNLYSESAGFFPNRVEFLCIQRLKENGKGTWTDETYTEAVNTGKISKSEFLNPLPNRQYGYGLAQFTTPFRKENLYERTVEKGISIADLQAQLEYIKYELKKFYPGVYGVLQTAKSVKEASDKVLKDFESPNNWQSLSATRADYGQQIYNTLAKIVDGGEPMGVTTKQIIDDAVSFAVNIANNDIHGYSQATRSLYNITNPKSFDCSSLVLTSYYYAFIKNGLITQANYLKANCSYTGNMMRMLNCGFEVVATNQTGHSKMVKGDVELNETHHTALAIDGNRIVHARSSEGTSDTIDGSGNEVRVQDWYMYSHGWTHRLRFTGKGISMIPASSPTDVSLPKSPSTTLLRRGSTGSSVKTLQQNLNKLMNANLTVDGDFGPATEKAVKAFQTTYKLEVDGIVGNETQKKISELLSTLQGKTEGSSKLNETEKFKGRVTTLLNVRVYAGKDYATCSFSPLSTGTIVSVCDTIKSADGSDWHFIKYQNKYGFASAKHIKEN